MTTETLRDVANKLVEYCRTQNEAKALSELYAPDAVSVEAVAMPGSNSREAAGLDAIRAKHAWWNDTMIVHSGTVEGPFFHGEDRFGVIYEVDVTNKSSNERSKMKEFGVYTLTNGKITREEFFYEY